MTRNLGITFLIILLMALTILFFLVPKGRQTFIAKPGETVELSFELDKKFEFGEYYFDMDNGKDATYPLCFCLSERNTYPPDCVGDIKYIYHNTPGTMCIPLHIGTGRCAVKGISTEGYSTMFLIPLEYQWTKPVEKIVLGVKVPEKIKNNSKIVVNVTIFKRDDQAKLQQYRALQQAIVVDENRQ